MAERSPSTTEVIAERIKSGSEPGKRDDPYRVSLILQGGAMRGAVSAGAAVALSSIKGEAEPFDQADLTSAGAFCWAYMAGRNPIEGAAIFYEEMTNGFIGYRNRLTKGRFVDLGLVIKTVTEGPKELDFEAILKHPTNTHIYASSALDAKKVKFKTGINYRNEPVGSTDDSYEYTCDNREQLLTALSATIQLPWWGGQPLRINEDMHLLDGGLTAGRVPLQESIADNCTHVLIISTDKTLNPQLYKKKFEEKLAKHRIRKEYPEMSREYWAGFNRHLEVLRILGSVGTAGYEGPVIDVIRADRHIPSSTETNPVKIYLAAKAGEWAAHQAFKPFRLSLDPKVTVRPPRANLLK